MLLVIVGLVVDIGRVMGIHSQVNSYSDRVALAAAAELDGRPGALQRAVNAVTGPSTQVPLGNRLKLAGPPDETAAVGIRRLVFLSSLANDPSDPFTRSPVSGDQVVAYWTPGSGFTRQTGFSEAQADAETHFVVVDPTRETENYLFFSLVASAIPGFDRSATVAPQAVAGFERQVCNTAPIMVCNPTEPTAGNPNASFDTTPGRMIRARLQQGTLSNSWGPGIYSLLDVSNPDSENALRRAMGSMNPGTACYGSSVIVERNPRRNSDDFRDRRDAINEGLNTRFDMYDGPMYGDRNNPDYAPAPNVTKGLRTDTDDRCENSTSGSTRPLPRTSPWSRNDYWRGNHNGANLPDGLNESSTRYDIYRQEITDQVGAARERKKPASLLHRTPDTNPARDRRILHVAIVNCIANRQRLRNRQAVEVEAYADMFLTEPAGNTDRGASADELDIEVRGPLGSDLPAETVREFPVLAR